MATLPDAGIWLDNGNWDDSATWSDYLQNSEAVNTRAFSSTTIGGSGVAVSQGVQEWEEIQDPNSQAVNRQLFGGVVNASGVAYEQRPNTPAAPIVILQNRVVARYEGTAEFNLQGIIKRSEPTDGLLKFGQVIGWKGDGSLIDFEQVINLRASSNIKAPIASFEHTIVNSENSGALFYLSQRVRDLGANAAAALSARPFELTILASDPVSGQIVAVPTEYLVGDLTITRGENEASLLDFTIMPAKGQQDIIEYQGWDIIVDYTDNVTRKSSRIYTGKIDIPEVDLISGLITYRCTDNRKEILNSLSRSKVEQIGYWSDDLFGDVEDQAEEIERRLETVQQSLDADRYGVMRLTSWTPNTIADIVFDDSSIYRRKPTISVISRGRVVNEVKIDLEFQYQRLRQRERDYNFAPFSTNSLCAYFTLATPPRKEMIRAAIDSAGWHYRGLELTDSLCSAGSLYNCKIFGAGYVYYPCGYYEGYYRDKTYLERQEDGSLVSKPVLDANGAVKQEFVRTSYTQTNHLYAHSATWTAAKRFSQSISEQVTLTVSAPKSIEQYGKVSKEISAGVRAEYDQIDDVENIDNYQYPLLPDYEISNGYVVNVKTGSRTSLSVAKSNPSTYFWPVSANGDYVIDLSGVDDGSSRWGNTFQAVVNRAITEIAKSHRNNVVSIEVPIQPDIELTNTVETSGNWVQCKGKVAAIRHTINMTDREAYTEIDIKLSRIRGNGGYSWTINSDQVRPQSRGDSASSVSPINLPITYIAAGDEITEADKGLIVKTGSKKPTAFVVDTPEIEEYSRDTREYVAEHTVNIDLRNDPLTISFNE